ncbi:MAG: hypothetical protein KBG48_09795 [Kofleriaceae bacterium]|nr:hypothetical protein [Kofleriaceae bacterium]MBP9167670.1 hypothetical protein [Kofleriaceae bacterium]MBP9862007.1 hypothetical protein [Kofleriaceae bacterium]
MHRAALSALAILVASATVAFAQPNPGPAQTSAQPSAQPSKPVKAKVIDITEADEITGDRPTGELTPIGIRQIAAGSSLLRIRQDFIDLIVKTADQI